MAKIEFSDGVVIDLEGQYRIEEYEDREGWCFLVVGHGMSVPFDTRPEAEIFLSRMQQARAERLKAKSE